MWAISSSGHSKGHVMYFINGIEDSVLFTGDASNTQYQFDTGIGPGTYSSDLEGGQDVLEQKGDWLFVRCLAQAVVCPSLWTKRYSVYDHHRP